MKITIYLQREAAPYLQQMAKVAGIGISDLAEIAVYNLIANYLKEHAQPQPFDAYCDDAGPI